MPNNKKSILKKQKFSKVQIGLFLLAFGLIGYLIFKATATSPLIATLQAESMKLPRKGASIITDSAASGGQAVQLTANSSVSGTVNLPGTATTLSVVARATQCPTIPTVSVSIGGSSVMSPTQVTSATYTSYSTSFTNTNLTAGSHPITVTFSNVSTGRAKKGQTTCKPTVYFDAVNFYGPDVTSLPPTVSLSANPITLSVGQITTLSWSSSNATSCTASGSWSGSQALSGSQDTAALSQTSTYSLTCTGTGGSTSKSVTVTVNPASPVPPPPPTVYLSPLSQTYALGSTLIVEVHENSGTSPVNAIQANFTYPTDKLTFVSIDQTGSAFSVSAQASGSNGQVMIGNGVCGGCAVLTGDQLVAKVNFTVNNVAGTANLPFTSGTSLVTSDTNKNILTSLSMTGSGIYTLQ